MFVSIKGLLLLLCLRVVCDWNLHFLRANCQLDIESSFPLVFRLIDERRWELNAYQIVLNLLVSYSGVDDVYVLVVTTYFGHIT